MIIKHLESFILCLNSFHYSFTPKTLNGSFMLGNDTGTGRTAMNMIDKVPVVMKLEV